MGATTFAALSDKELAQHRGVLRQALDDEVHRFHPHLIHVQHLWLFAHLALESGAPYVVEVFGPELAHDRRVRHLIEQAAENAGRLFVSHEGLRTELHDRFELAPERILGTMPTAASMASVYEAMLIERFGHVPP